METYVAALNYAIPFFVILLVVEVFVAKWKGARVVRAMDTLSSLSSGMTNIVKDVLGLTLIIISYEWLVTHVALVKIEATWVVYVVAFIGIDFAGYWVHRIAHQVNYFWNHHIIHHSSEEFNLGCALRQSVSELFSITFIFLVPLALLGIPSKVLAILGPLHLFAQYWYHTRLIGKMGILEYIIVTPSHHRVHHAINKEYLDKNLSQVFIIWDKLFGTFQEERDDIPPVYGVKRPVRTWNPFIINFVHLAQIIKDAWHARRWIDKFRIWFMPTGWRPDDVVKKFPVDTIEDVYQYKKYDPPVSSKLQAWTWFQFIVHFALMMYYFNNLVTLDATGLALSGTYMFYGIFCYTMLLDQNKYALLFETIKALFGLSILSIGGWDWFGIGAYSTPLVLALAGYFVLVPVVAGYFHYTEIKPVRMNSVAS